MTSHLSRRHFVRNCSLAGSALALSAASYSRVLGANERLRIACVGTGGKGWSDLTGVAASPAVQVVALCDVDQSQEHLGRAAMAYPQAEQYADWRPLLDKSQDIHGLIVSTPDFMHAPIALAAMHLGKHIFCQKPLTHTVQEARQMRLAAEKYQLVTQMCNQIQSHEAYRTATKIVRDGWIGKVSAVHSWQGGAPSWPRAIDRPAGSDPVPSTLRWDLWQGVAAERPYKNQLYHPFNWRGWQAYGTGQLGDFGCHILDPVFTAIGLTAPTEVVAEAPPIHAETWTDRATVRYLFPKTELTMDAPLPVTWYDAAGALPPRDQLPGIPADYSLPGAGSVIVGEKGSLLVPHVAMPKLFPEEKFAGVDVPVVPSVDHYVQWADACRGESQTTSHFSYSGPLTEAVLVGTIALRLPGQRLQWDSANLRFPHSSEAQKLVTKPYRKGWEPTWL
jgi:predicted dehydrogenase